MPTEKRIEKLRKVVARREAGLVVVLEDVHDPHNAAAILRSCDAFGVQEVYFVFEREKRYNPRKVGKVSSASANKWLDFEIFDSTEHCLRLLKEDGYTVAATLLDVEAQNIMKTKLTDKKIALVVGNEHRGVSDTVVAMADMKLYIPMQGVVQSLNVSVSAAIALYEISRQRHARRKSFKISKDKRLSLLADFLDR